MWGSKACSVVVRVAGGEVTSTDLEGAVVLGAVRFASPLLETGPPPLMAHRRRGGELDAERGRGDRERKRRRDGER